jgi:hypothetical protein
MTLATLDDFITQVFRRFPPKGDDNIQLMKLNEYREFLKSDNTYHFDNAYTRLVSSYKYQVTPSIDELRDILSQNIIKEFKNEDTTCVTETLIVRKGKYNYEYGVKLADYQKDIEYFKRNGFNVIKLKYCNQDCMKCNYNHVCLTAAEKRA